jgi:hypothetical protein
MTLDPIQAFLMAAHEALSKFTAARADLDKEYAERRASIDAEILKWKRAMDSVLAVAESEQTDPADVEVSAFVDGKAGRQKIKFTDAVRMCLKQRGDKPASAPDVRDGLINFGFDFGKYAQPLVPIHNCLKRLVEQGEAEPVKNDEGQVIGYKWISAIERALAEEPIGYGDATGSYLAGTYMHDAQRMAQEAKRSAEGTVRRFIEENEAMERAVAERIERIAKSHQLIHATKRNKKD